MLSFTFLDFLDLGLLEMQEHFSLPLEIFSLPLTLAIVLHTNLIAHSNYDLDLTLVLDTLSIATNSFDIQLLYHCKSVYYFPVCFRTLLFYLGMI